MGTLWNRSGTIERYADDIRAAGAKAYFYNGGTTTAMTVFHDAGASSAHTFPVVADANGRWPDIFIPYTVSYDVRVTTADNVQLTYTLQIPNPNPVDVTTTVPAANTITTGMIHGEMVNATKAGYVRLNGRTMGNSSSSSAGAERNNDDTQALFIYLYNNLPDSIAPVSGGRVGPALADFTANKTIVLPNWQGAGPVGLDDMGATAGGFFSGLTFSQGDALTPGSLTGTNGVTLSIANMPAHSHTGTTSDDGFAINNKLTSIQDVSHTHSGTTGAGSAHQHAAFIGDDQHTHGTSGTLQTNNSSLSVAGPGVPAPSPTTATINAASTGVKVRSTAGNAATADNQTATESVHTHGFTSGIQSVDHHHTFSITALESSHHHTITTSSQGSGTGFNNLGRSRLVTWFIKL